MEKDISCPYCGAQKAFHKLLGKAPVCTKAWSFLLLKKILRADSATFSSGIFLSIVHSLAQFLFLLQSL